MEIDHRKEPGRKEEQVGPNCPRLQRWILLLSFPNVCLSLASFNSTLMKDQLGPSA